MLISADSNVMDNHWWKKLFRMHAAVGEYFEIHCWNDEKDALQVAETFGKAACYTIPDLKIVHGHLTERLITYMEHCMKPIECECYNKMVPFFTIRIGDHFSSEKYGTEIILRSRSVHEKVQIEGIVSGRSSGITVYYNE